MEKVTKLCAWCGEKPVRRMGGKQSRYCSKACGLAARSAFSKAAADAFADARAENMEALRQSLEKSLGKKIPHPEPKAVEPKIIPPVAVTPPDPVSPVVPPAPKVPVADDLPMCAWCGQYAVRRTKTALSRFCSERCAKASHDDASRKANAAMNRKMTISSSIYFPATTPQQDWRDANFNPLG